jgi:hypothetical protein
LRKRARTTSVLTGDIRIVPANMTRLELVGEQPSVFDRYAKRMKAREEDLRRGKKSEDQIESHLATEREKQRPKLVEECADAVALLERLGMRVPPDAVMAIADAVAGGADAKVAVLRLLPAGNAVVRGASA